ncbi:MAG: DUF1992 domain-containing protein [Chloroflexi bacterium]|nr:DUF1992 domain-containing protein [Chloroflexota bacterium]
MPDRPTPSQPRKLHQWESAVDKQIREAQERGDFDALPGRGKPLPRDSWGGGEWALAYHVLKQAGETLPWIALGREIEVAEERLRKLAESARSMPPADRVRARERYLREAAALDKMLLEYSFLIPSRRLEKGRLPPHIAARQWDSALGA